MKIAILGTRGIPNYHGGFEQFAEYLAKDLADKHYDITVYNSHDHPYKEKIWNGVHIVHCFDPEKRMGTAGQFIYDLNCIMHARKQEYDIILQLGYTSSTVWSRLLPSNAIITTNMDGLEWKRSKYTKQVKKFLKYAELLGVKFSDYLIADSLGIKEYIEKRYQKECVYIPYGAFPFKNADIKVLDDFQLKAFCYNLLIARLEPENNIDVILKGVVQSGSTEPFLVIGKYDTKYGGYLKKKYQKHTTIRFPGAIYDINILNNLRWYSKLYFHGHSVGGTNPSLLEAMASKALICAHKNLFNGAILGDDGFYFQSDDEVAHLIASVVKDNYGQFLENNMDKIKNIYRWDLITAQYEEHFKTILDKKRIKNFSMETS